MRARQLKPEFFTDRKIAAMGPVAALVYQVLWVTADDGGVAPCDADRLKGEMFWAWPSIASDDIAGALLQLEEMDRIRVYVIGDDSFAELVMFHRHQKPHNPSSFRYPRPGAPTSPAGASADDVTHEDGGRAEAGLQQEGGTPRHPNPLSLIPDPEPQNPVSGDTIAVHFDAVWQAYPKRAGGSGKADALAQYRARRREGVPHQVILDGVVRYAAYCDATRKTGTEYVKQAKTFLGKSRHYEEPWDVPAGSGHASRAARNGSTPRQYDYVPTTTTPTVR